MNNRQFILSLFVVISAAIILLAATAPPKSGYLYVISNVGSFGENVYKIGYTQREPQKRIDELGDASVPFKFDIHIIIESDDILKLERAIHDELDDYRVNKINRRKEFFRCNLDKIIETIKKHHSGELKITREPHAWEYQNHQKCKQMNKNESKSREHIQDLIQEN
jgi:hypothetical protein